MILQCTPFTVIHDNPRRYITDYGLALLDTNTDQMTTKLRILHHQ